MLVNFSGVEFSATVSEFQKRWNKAVSDVAVVQRRQRNEQKRVMHVQSFVLLIWTYSFFRLLVAAVVVVASLIKV